MNIYFRNFRMKLEAQLLTLSSWTDASPTSVTIPSRLQRFLTVQDSSGFILIAVSMSTKNFLFVFCYGKLNCRKLFES